MAMDQWPGPPSPPPPPQARCAWCAADPGRGTQCVHCGAPNPHFLDESFSAFDRALAAHREASRGQLSVVDEVGRLSLADEPLAG